MAHGPHRSPDALTLPLPEQIALCLRVLMSFHKRYYGLPFGKHLLCAGHSPEDLSPLHGHPETYALLVPFKDEASEAQNPLPWQKAPEPVVEQVPTRPV